MLAQLEMMLDSAYIKKMVIHKMMRLEERMGITKDNQ